MAVSALTITGRQLTAARGLASMTQQKLARLAGVRVETIGRMEGFDEDPVGALPETLEKVTRALEAAGVEFLNDPRPGVRMRKR